MMLWILPVFPILCAAASYAIGRRSASARDRFAVCAGLAELALCIWLLFLPAQEGRLLGLTLELDGFRKVYCLVIAFLWAMTLLFSPWYFAHHHRRNRYYFFNLMTLGATLGVFLAADLLTAFVFFEVMSFTSYPWVAQEEEPEALRAADTYLAIAVIGGLVALMGLFLLQHTLGTLRLSELYDRARVCANRGVLYAAGGCILFGFGAKAGMFPLHIWLPKAHPVAPAPASALLSGILTKSGIFGVIVVSANIFRASTAWGNMLLVLGLITMLGGAVLAVFSINLKRTLACSSMSQIGFILTGIAMGCLLGEENALAARGALLYMVNHSLFKLVLFMAAGVVYMNLHKLNLNDVRGFGRKKPILHFAFLMGAVGLMGVPGFSGYVSKTLIHEGIVEYAELLAEEGMGALALLYRGAEWIYLFSGGLTAAYMIKLYICLFWEKHPTQQIAYEAKKPYMGKLSALALLLSAAIVPALGLTPNLTMDKIADIAGGFLNAAAPAHAVHYFSLTNIKGACISLAIGLIVYLLFIRTKLMKKENGVREYVDLWPSWLDIEDRLYRPAIGGLLELGGRFAGLGSETTLETYVYRPMIRALTLFFAAVFGFLGGLTDFVADLIARKVLSARRKKLENRVGNAVTRAVGGVFDGMVEGLNQTVLRGHQIEHHAMARISAAWDGVMDAISQMSHTMSYGLLLFGLGLCVTLLYLMFY